MGVDLIQECQRSLALVQEDVEDGILYLDAGAGEAFHFSGGLPSMLELGARAICSLEQASPFDAAVSWRGTEQDPVEKIVILTSRLLTESHRDVVRCLRMHPSVKQFKIWTSISEEAHSAHPDTAFGLGAFHDYKNSLLRELAKDAAHAGGRGDISSEASKKSDLQSHGGKDTEVDTCVPNQLNVRQSEAPDVEVKHFPMMVCSFTKSLFVFPSGGSVAGAPLSNRQDIQAMSKGIPGVDVTSQFGGEERIPAGATLLAHSLQHMASQLDLKFEVFTLGPLAHAIGKVMSGLSSPSDGVGHARRAAGLVLVDRSQDLVTPSCHGDSLLDRVFSSLPRRRFPTESTTSRPSQVLSSSVARPPMDLRIPINHEEEKVGSSVLSHFFPVTTTFGKVVNKTSSRDSIAEDGIDKVCSTPLSLPGDIVGPHVGLLEGSLSTSWDQRSSEYLECLIGKRTKDSLLVIRKWLQDALRLEKLTAPGRGRLGAVSMHELRSLRRALAENPEVALRHVALIQVARAAEVALGSHRASHWDAFAGAERILMLSSGDRSQSLALQLQDIVQQSAQSLRRHSLSGSASSTDFLSLRDALTLGIVAYGLAGEGMHSGGNEGPFAWDEEQALKEAIVEAILQGSSEQALGFLKGLDGALASLLEKTETKEKPTSEKVSVPQRFISTDEEWDRWEGIEAVEDEGVEVYGKVQLKLELRDRLGEVFGVLHKVATACYRNPLRELALPVENQSNGGGLHVGLMYKLLSLIFAKVDIPGLEHHVSGMGRFFKGGLGRFGIRQAKPKVSDQKVLVVFVIGGLNFVEVREANEAQAAVPGGEGVELLLGGTTLTTPNDMYDLLLGSCGSV